MPGIHFCQVLLVLLWILGEGFFIFVQYWFKSGVGTQHGYLYPGFYLRAASGGIDNA
jgi:hypothetical protein